MARNLTQKITRWVQTRGFGGTSFNAPTVIRGRWEERKELFLGETGKEEVSKAIIALDTQVNIDDFLFLGSSTVTDPTTLPGASEVRSYKEMSNLSGTEVERIAVL